NQDKLDIRFCNLRHLPILLPFRHITRMSAVLITLHDVEPAVRLNAALEKEGFKTEVVSPMDDVRGIVSRIKPELMVVTGALTAPHVEAIVREQLWGGAVGIGLSDVSDAEQLEKI